MHTRGIWKGLSTNPIMFGIILKNYFSALIKHKLHDDVMMHEKYYWEIMHCLHSGKRKFQWKIYLLSVEKCAEH